MNCRQAEHLLLAERDGTLEQARRAELALHIESCATCRRIRNDLDVAVTHWRAAESAIRVPDADLEWRKVMRAINPPVPASRRYRNAWLALPAAVAAAAVLGLYYVTPGSGPEHLNSAAPRTIARRIAVSAPAAPQASTVVYVDEKSGWTFVWAADDNGNGHI